MTDWREMTDAEREALPVGSEGWRWDRVSPLPVGQFVERLREVETFANGGSCHSIRWGSNGVGRPAMTLLGTQAKVPGEHQPGWHPLPHGAYQGFTPASPEANAQPKGGKAKATKPEPTP